MVESVRSFLSLLLFKSRNFRRSSEVIEANRSEVVLSQSQKSSIKLSNLDFILCSQNNSCNDGSVRWELYGEIKVLIS